MVERRSETRNWGGFGVKGIDPRLLLSRSYSFYPETSTSQSVPEPWYIHDSCTIRVKEPETHRSPPGTVYLHLNLKTGPSSGVEPRTGWEGRGVSGVNKSSRGRIRSVRTVFNFPVNRWTMDLLLVRGVRTRVLRIGTLDLRTLDRKVPRGVSSYGVRDRSGTGPLGDRSRQLGTDRAGSGLGRDDES